MLNISKNDIQNSIIKYLEYELELEVKKAFKDKIPSQTSINNKREKLKPNFEYKTWLNSLNDSLNFMQNHELSLATHISKGIHSAVRSDNIIFNIADKNMPFNFASSIDIPNPKLDANSNNTGSHAGHLKIIVNFLNIEILESRFYSLIINRNPAMYEFINQYLSNYIFDYLSGLLNSKITNPTTDSRNKQTLFPIKDNTYHCIVPLFPSSLTHYVYQEINNIKYSEFSKNARKIRFDKVSLESPAVKYKDIIDLAVVKLGGENAQNVSRFNNIQGGFHYLLPSMPPMIKSRNDTFRPSKFADTIFAKSLAYRAQPAIDKVLRVIKDTRNTVDIRDLRKLAIDEILQFIFTAAESMRTTLPAGWSKDYELDECEKLWLDPKRSEMEGEEEFKAKREGSDDWHQEIIYRFARWLNTLLQEAFKDIERDFSDPEHREWEREIEAMKKQYERSGKGVFL